MSLIPSIPCAFLPATQSTFHSRCVFLVFVFGCLSEEHYIENTVWPFPFNLNLCIFLKTGTITNSIQAFHMVQKPSCLSLLSLFAFSSQQLFYNVLLPWKILPLFFFSFSACSVSIVFPALERKYRPPSEGHSLLVSLKVFLWRIVSLLMVSQEEAAPLFQGKIPSSLSWTLIPSLFCIFHFSLLLALSFLDVRLSTT